MRLIFVAAYVYENILTTKFSQFTVVILFERLPLGQ